MYLNPGISSFQLVEGNPGDSQLWQRTTNLKSRDPTLKVFLSIGESKHCVSPKLVFNSFERWLGFQCMRTIHPLMMISLLVADL
jgi:hypothetical protein